LRSLLWMLLVSMLAQATGHAAWAQAGFSTVDQLVERAVAEKQIPGAVVVIGHRGKVVFRRSYGWRSLEPDRERMTAETVFDMASLTKPLMTATAIMQLYQRGLIRLDDPVAKYLPAFGANGKEDITIRQLLTHHSGLPPDLSLTDSWEGKDEAYRRAFAIELAHPAGTQFVYSDINYMVLGALIEKLSGLTLDQYCTRSIIAPLGLEHTRFLPPVSWRPRIAPTQYDNGVMLRGIVHDPTSRRMGGVAGHAGLFSTADDLGVLSQQLLDRLAGRPSRFPLKRPALWKMVTPEQPATGTALRGFGWDIDSPYSSNRGTLLPVGSFGHTGFTGTSLWIDPGSDTYVILLTNSVHPNGHRSSIVALRGQVADAAATALGIRTDGGALAARLTGYNESLSGMRSLPARNGEVKTGIDVLETDHFSLLSELASHHDGKLRVGLLTNQTGIDSRGRRTTDVLMKDAHEAVPGFELKMLFSPEHGITGSRDQPQIEDAVDKATGLPIVSLYGTSDARRRPPLDQMRSLDVVVIDLQDAGVRFYTYETLVGYFLEAAAQTGTEIVVLDRPNPITGSLVQGPVSDPNSESYVNYMPIPVRHGMTLGELALFFKQQRGLKAPLTVVAMQGWQRGDWLDSTGLTWINPSPNLRDLEEATLYPALGLIETTNISVGRGTDAPFEVFGAPWVDGRALALFLNRRFLPGVRFLAVDQTPQAPYPYAGEVCHDVRILVTDRNRLDAPELGVEIASALHHFYPDKFQLAKMQTLLESRQVLDAIEAGEDPQRIADEWRPGIETFEQERQKALLYSPVSDRDEDMKPGTHTGSKRP